MVVEDLARWLTACLDEDERIARATDDTLGQRQLTWSVEPVDDAFSKVLAGGRYVVGTGEFTPEDAAHIVAWGPARVLREIEAKRELLAELLPAPAEPETDAQLHARFAHPAWEYRATEGPRKQWDDVDVPPCDESGDPQPGWERNTDAGRDGWERWDYTEESYWRRRLPGGQERKSDIPRWLRLMAAVYADRPGYLEAWRP